MSKFKEGDKVVRTSKVATSHMWTSACSRAGINPGSVLTVVLCSEEGRLDVDRLLEEDAICWSADGFRLATDLEIHQGVALLVEDHIAEKEEHVECLRNLLEVEKQKVQDLTAQLDFAKTLAAESNDQRDAAVAAAKALGEDLRVARADRRLLRFYQAQVDGVATGLVDAVSDFTMSLSVLRTHLEQIGKMCDEQGNGADAKVMFDAASLCDVVVRATDALNELQEKQPDIYPEIEPLD